MITPVCVSCVPGASMKRESPKSSTRTVGRRGISPLSSASKNTSTVLARLGITGLFDEIVDGNTDLPPKPAPDVFAEAARRIGVPPGLCVVVEDAAAGIEGALAAGMWTVGLGPAERVGTAHVRLDDLSHTTVASLLAGLETAAWTVHEPVFTPEQQGHSETIFTVGNGALCVRGSLEEGHPGDHPAAFMHQLWDDMPISFSELASLPQWWGVDVWVNGERFRLDLAAVPDGQANSPDTSVPGGGQLG